MTVDLPLVWGLLIALSGARCARMTAITDKRPRRGAGRRLLWFVGLWLAGVDVLATVAGLLRLAIGIPSPGQTDGPPLSVL